MGGEGIIDGSSLKNSTSDWRWKPAEPSQGDETKTLMYYYEDDDVEFPEEEGRIRSHRMSNCV